MATVRIPNSFPFDVVDISESNPRPIDNGKLAASAALKPLEQATHFLAAGLGQSFGGSCFAKSRATTMTLTGRFAAPPFALGLELALRISVYGGAASDTVTAAFVTENDGTGTSAIIPANQASGINNAWTFVLSADLADGTKTARELDVTWTLTLTPSGGSSSTTYLWGYGLRLLSRSGEEVTI